MLLQQIDQIQQFLEGSGIIKGKLLSGRHKVVREFIKALKERLPGVIFCDKNDRISNFFDINFSAVYSKVFWQYHNLMSSIGDNFGCVHGASSLN
jgi:hypothetical protein